MRAITKLLSLAAGVLSAVAIAAPGQAAVIYTLGPGAPDPGPAPGQNRVIDFNSGLPSGVTVTGDAAIVGPGDVAGTSAAPAGDNTPYLTTPFAVFAGSSTLMFSDFVNNQDVTGFSFYWGSIDAYNSFQLVHRDGTLYGPVISGDSILPHNGSHTSPLTNQRIFVTLTGADRDLGGIKFTSGKRAFEIDDLAFGGVPEPMTWALMILGFAGMGAMIRSSRQRGFASAA